MFPAAMRMNGIQQGCSFQTLPSTFNADRIGGAPARLVDGINDDRNQSIRLSHPDKPAHGSFRIACSRIYEYT